MSRKKRKRKSARKKIENIGIVYEKDRQNIGCVDVAET